MMAWTSEHRSFAGVKFFRLVNLYLLQRELFELKLFWNYTDTDKTFNPFLYQFSMWNSIIPSQHERFLCSNYKFNSLERKTKRFNSKCTASYGPNWNWLYLKVQKKKKWWWSYHSHLPLFISTTQVTV